LAKAIAQLSFW